MSSVTVKDVAKAAGVSHATVMRVIHKNGYVSDTAQKNVEKAIADLGYMQNQAASSLKNQRTNLICHLGLLSANHVFDKVCAGLMAAAEPEGYSIINIPCLYEPGKKVSIVEQIECYPFDGVITSSLAGVDDESLKRIKKSKIPFVMLERTLPLSFADRIYFDDMDASRQAVTHLYETGCRRIAYVGPNEKVIFTDPLMKTEEKRLNGYLDAVYSFDLIPRVVNTGDYQMKNGYRAMDTLLKDAGVPDGIVAASDVLACGVLRRLIDQEDDTASKIRVVGSDNSIAPMLPLPIASMEFDYVRATQIAMEFMVSRLKDPEREPREAKVMAKLVRNG